MAHLVVLVIDAEPLPQVSEHHGTVLFKLKATRQVFSDNKETQSHTHGQHDKQELRGLMTMRKKTDVQVCLLIVDPEQTTIKMHTLYLYKLRWRQLAANSRANPNIRIFSNISFQFTLQHVSKGADVFMHY